MERKRSSGLTGLVATGAMIGAAALGLKGVEHYLEGKYLHAENFQDAEWVEYNPGGILWEAYTTEKIPHNMPNWNLYMSQVREKNKNSLQGNILLPDLDGNGRVGEK